MAEPASNRPSRLDRLQEQVRTLINEDAVAESDSQMSRQHRFAHFWILVAQMFLKNRGPVRAASLAYTTLLALVPLLAISLSVATLFLPRNEVERRETLVDWIEQGVNKAAPMLGLSGQGGEEQRVNVAARIVEFVERIHFGKITATAAAGLIVVAIGLLRTIEVAFNDIWGVTRGRTLLMSVVFYWAVITLGPAVLLVTKGVKVLSIVEQHSSTLKNSALGPLLLSVDLFASPVLMVLAFAALYLWMPNTRVQWRAAFVGGGVASLLWTLNNSLSSLYHSKVLTYNAIYGSLGALPIFLVGVYLTWLIVLFGAQVAYVYQNRRAYLQERVAGRIHQQAREFAALRLMTFIAARFHAGEPPVSSSSLAEQLGIPPNLAKDILRTLAECRILNETRGSENAYIPARPLDKITVWNVLQTMRVGSGSDLVTAADAQRSVVGGVLAEVRAVTQSKSGSVTLDELVRRTAADPA